MRGRTRWAASGAVLALVAIAGAARTGAADTPGAVVLRDAPVGASPLAASELTLLSYNVEGLPWPVARGRADAAASIADALRTMRAQGRQPQIVALQEAFGGAAKAIGRDAGYAYAAFGPPTDLPRAAPTTQADRDFVAAASAWHGETLGKHVDSGLAIFSDYPILWVKRVAFPAYACAGWDCMANKGVLAVALRIPGSDKPVIVFDTHLNSRDAAKVDKARADYAYRRQIDALSAFVGETAGAGDRVLMAGDFNVGRDAARVAYMGDRMMTDDRLTVAGIEYDCGHACRAVGAIRPGEATALQKAKSLVVFRADEGASLAPLGAAVGFGRTATGHMLSDHIGLAARFRIDGGGATQIADNS